MKANKFYACALAALALVGFTSCNPVNNVDDEKKLELTEATITMKVGETHQLVANVAVDSWTSLAPEVATVDDKGLVTAVAEGSSIITATTAKGATASCIVKVTKDGQGGGEGDDPVPVTAVKGSKIWTIILDQAAADANASKIVASFAPDDNTKFLYVWESTYVGNDSPTGRGFYGADGYTAMTVAGTWSGAGFCLTEAGTAWQDAEALRAAIVEDPDNYFLHLAIKSTDSYSHCFYIFNCEQTKFGLGSATPYGGSIYANFTRDGEWHEFDIPMSKYANALATTKFEAGGNVFVLMTEGVVGAQINLDAVYFYKK